MRRIRRTILFLPLSSLLILAISFLFTISLFLSSWLGNFSGILALCQTLTAPELVPRGQLHLIGHNGPVIWRHRILKLIRNHQRWQVLRIRVYIILCISWVYCWVSLIYRISCLLYRWIIQWQRILHSCLLHRLLIHEFGLLDLLIVYTLLIASLRVLLLIISVHLLPWCRPIPVLHQLLLMLGNDQSIIPCTYLWLLASLLQWWLMILFYIDIGCISISSMTRRVRRHTFWRHDSSLSGSNAEDS